ncbi:MAG TPA: hypothetical protein VGF79_15700, partial [Bacteroidia bacterium]
IEKNFKPDVLRLNPSNDYSFVVKRIRYEEEKDHFIPSNFDHLITDQSLSRINVTLREFSESIKRTTNAQIIESIEQHEFDPSKSIIKYPVIIFDQFEELITLFEETSIYEVDTSNAEFTNEHKIRIQLQDEIINVIKENFYDQNSAVKFIFVFREDYLAKFYKLFKVIPDVIDHSIRISPLKSDLLATIIERPFISDEAKKIYKSEFIDHPDLIKKIVGKFKDRYKDDNLILTEVQIVSKYLYDSTLDKDQKLSLLDQNECLDNIIKDYQLSLIDKLGIGERKAATDVLSMLVLDDKVRNVRHENDLKTHLKKHSPQLIDKTLNDLEFQLMLIRKEKRNDGHYYEIVSESIIPYFNKRRIESEIRLKEKKKRAIIIIISLVFILSLIVYGSFKHNNSIKEDLKKKEFSWYKFLLDDDTRKEIISTLIDKEDEPEYFSTRRSFQLLAFAHKFESSSDYQGQFYSSYHSNILNDIPLNRKYLNNISEKFLFPEQTITLKTNEKKQIVSIRPAGNQYIFVCFSDNSIQYMSLDQKEIITLNSFKENNTDYYFGYYLKKNPEIKPVGTDQRPQYLIYFHTKMVIFDPIRKTYKFYELNKTIKNGSILNVIEIRPNVYRVFTFENYFDIENGKSLKSTQSINQSSEYSPYYRFTNKNIFSLHNKQTGKITFFSQLKNDTLLINEKDRIMDINEKYNILKNSSFNRFKLTDRNNKSLFEFSETIYDEMKLMIDTSFVLVKNANSLKVYSQGGSYVETKFPEGFSFELIKNSNYILIVNQNNYSLYNPINKKWKQLFIPLQKNIQNLSHYDEFESSNSTENITFIDSTKFMIFTDKKIHIYDIGNVSNTSKVLKEKTYANEIIELSINKIFDEHIRKEKSFKIDENDSTELMSIVKKYINNTEYDTALIFLDKFAKKFKEPSCVKFANQNYADIYESKYESNPDSSLRLKLITKAIYYRDKNYMMFKNEENLYSITFDYSKLLNQLIVEQKYDEAIQSAKEAKSKYKNDSILHPLNFYMFIAVAKKYKDNNVSTEQYKSAPFSYYDIDDYELWEELISTFKQSEINKIDQLMAQESKKHSYDYHIR